MKKKKKEKGRDKERKVGVKRNKERRSKKGRREEIKEKPKSFKI